MKDESKIEEEELLAELTDEDETNFFSEESNADNSVERDRNFKEKALLYSFPLLSLFVIALLLLGRPEIVGFAVAPFAQQQNRTPVRFDISVEPGVVLPYESVAQISVNNKSKHYYLKALLGSNVSHGSLPEFGYYGDGYTGNYSFTVDLEEIYEKPLKTGNYTVVLKIYYKGRRLTSSERVIEKKGV